MIIINKRSASKLDNQGWETDIKILDDLDYIHVKDLKGVFNQWFAIGMGWT